MTTVDDALDAAAAAAAAATAATGRLDAVERHQLTMTTQLAGIAQQLQALLNPGGGGGGAGGGGGGGGGGAGGGGGGGGAGGAGGGGGGATTQRRRIDPSCLDKLHGDASLSQLRTWRNRWSDFCQLNQLVTYPVSEQMAAFRMVLDPDMQQIVEVALGISSTAATTPEDVLDQINIYIRSKRNIALDRVAFEDCHQSATESFDDFYIRLCNLADAADLCAACRDTRLTTRIMAGVRDTETKRKLLALSPFPTAQQTINICRSEESAKADEKSLSNPPAISHVQTRSHRQPRQTDGGRCGSCGRLAWHGILALAWNISDHLPGRIAKLQRNGWCRATTPICLHVTHHNALHVNARAAAVAVAALTAATSAGCSAVTTSAAAVRRLYFRFLRAAWGEVIIGAAGMTLFSDGRTCLSCTLPF
jgi:hypothetical protein